MALFEFLNVRRPLAPVNSAMAVSPRAGSTSPNWASNSSALAASAFSSFRLSLKDHFFDSANEIGVEKAVLHCRPNP